MPTTYDEYPIVTVHVCPVKDEPSITIQTYDGRRYVLLTVDDKGKKGYHPTLSEALDQFHALPLRIEKEVGPMFNEDGSIVMKPIPKKG